MINQDVLLLDVLLLAIAVVYLLIAIKRVAKDERIVFFKSDKPMSVAGPGLILVWPLVQNSKKLDVRTHSLSLPQIKPAGDACSSIVSGQFSFQICDPLKAATIANVRNHTEQAVKSTLSDVLATATIQRCLVENLLLEKQVIELMNQQTVIFGVKVTALTLSEFPIHRRLASQLAGMADRLVVDLAAMIEQVAQKQCTDREFELQDDTNIPEHNLEYKFGINV